MYLQNINQEASLFLLSLYELVYTLDSNFETYELRLVDLIYY
jgi:hypothetical protein